MMSHRPSPPPDLLPPASCSRPPGADDPYRGIADAVGPSPPIIFVVAAVVAVVPQLTNHRHRHLHRPSLPRVNRSFQLTMLRTTRTRTGGQLGYATTRQPRIPMWGTTMAMQGGKVG